MKLYPKPTNSTELKKKTRVILEKSKDLCRGKKFDKIISKCNITNSLKECDILICLNQIKLMLDCYLIEQVEQNDIATEKINKLKSKINILICEVEKSVTTRNKIKKKFIADVLRQHTKTFKKKHLKSKINGNCNENYDKFVFSSISVWNNNF